MVLAELWYCSHGFEGIFVMFFDFHDGSGIELFMIEQADLEIPCNASDKMAVDVFMLAQHPIIMRSTRESFALTLNEKTFTKCA